MRFVFVLLALLVIGCPANDSCERIPAPDEVALGAIFDLQENQGTQVSGEDLTVQFLSVSDSRCPAGVECVSAGMAEVFVELTKAGNPPVVVRVLADSWWPESEKQANYLNYTIRIAGLNTCGDIAVEHPVYTAQFVITKQD